MKQRFVAGLDVHRSIIAASLLGPDGELERRTFATNLRDLQELRCWLVERHCEVVGMEATGVYWKPIHRVLEQNMRVIVANPHHIKAIKGRKTDRADADWIAGKVADEAISPSFIPGPKVRDSRDLARYRQNLVRASTQIRNQIHKLLSGAGVPLGPILSDLFGASGRAILGRLKNGEQAWGEDLLAILKGKAKEKAPALRLALEMPLSESQRWELSAQLERLDRVGEDLRRAEEALEPQLGDYQEARARLTAIPGIGWEGAGLLLAHVGTDLSSFPDGNHFAAWVGLSPGSNETGGKQRPSGRRKGNQYLQGLFDQFAHGATRTKGSWIQRKFQSLSGRMIRPKAIIAIARKLAVLAFKAIQEGMIYQDRDDTYVPGERKRWALKRAIALITHTGGKVTLVA